jgi:hypothetical protein
MGVLGILEQEDTVRFKRSQLHALFLVYVQFLNETTWWCWGNICGVFVIEWWVAILINNQLVPWEEIKKGLIPWSP